MVATRSELAVRRWSTVTDELTDELIGQLRLSRWCGRTAGGVIMR